MPGLYDDEFVGYRIATDDELDVALREAVVAVDAHVLLGLYRFLPQTANDVLKILARLEERLVVRTRRCESSGGTVSAQRVAQ